MKYPLCIAALLLSGCGHLEQYVDPIPNTVSAIEPQMQPIADWPTLKVIEHDEGVWAMLKACSKYTNPLTWPPIGCTEVEFDEMTCNIWFIGPLTRREELKHCAGGDHDGALSKAWQEWKKFN